MSEAPQRIWAWRYASTSKPSAPPYKLARGAWDNRASERHASDVEYIRADRIATHPAVAALVDLLAEASTDLKGYVEADYPESVRGYPSMQKKYERDMALANSIDAALAALRATKDGA